MNPLAVITHKTTAASILSAISLVSLLLVLPVVNDQRSTSSISGQAHSSSQATSSALVFTAEAEYEKEDIHDKSRYNEEIPLMKQSEDRNLVLGVIVDDYANKYGELSSFEEIAENKIRSVTIFKQFGNNNNYIIADDISYILSSNYELVISWEPWNPEEGMNQSRDYLEEIISGAQDKYIRKFANQIQEIQGSVVMRFAHEMNGNWYPWAQQPDKYIQAYSYIFNVFNQEGVTDIKWEWSVNAENVPYLNPLYVSEYYPGDEMVNRIGISGYNFGHSNWRSFDEIFKPMYKHLVSTYSQKVVISEIASAEAGGNKAEWIAETFREIKSNQFQRISQVTWFNLLKERDWRVDSSESSATAYKSAIR